MKTVPALAGLVGLLLIFPIGPSDALARPVQPQPLSLGAASSFLAATSPIDCDEDGDAGTDPNEYQECVPPTLPEDPAIPPDVKQNLKRDQVTPAFQPSTSSCWAAAGILGGGAVVEFFSEGAATPLVARAYRFAVVRFGKNCVLALVEKFGRSTTLDDPPDPRFRRIFFPRALHTPKFLPSICKPAWRRSAVCKTFIRSSESYFSAMARLAALWSAEGVTLGRYSAAVEAGDPTSAQLQLALSNTNLGLIAFAERRREKAGSRFAKALNGVHARINLTRSAFRQITKRLLRNPPRKLVAILREQGYSRAQIKQAVRSDLRAGLHGRFRPLTSWRTLGAKRPTGVFSRAYGQIETGQLAALIFTMTLEKLISPQLNVELNDDLQRMRFECGPTERLAAAKAFVRDAEAGAGGKARELLVAAARPLTKSPSAIPPCP
jgi:hypothetical protein